MSDPIRPEIAAVIKRIDDLRPQLVDAGREGDQLRRIQPAAFDALAATGASASLRRRGSEASPPTPARPMPSRELSAVATAAPHGCIASSTPARG